MVVSRKLIFGTPTCFTKTIPSESFVDGQLGCVLAKPRKLFLIIIFIQLKHELGCRVPWVMNSSMPVCDKMKAERASEIYYMAQKMPPCVQPCCSKEVDVTNKWFETTMNGNTEMELRFPPSVKFYVEFEGYGLVSMLAGRFKIEYNDHQ